MALVSRFVRHGSHESTKLTGNDVAVHVVFGATDQGLQLYSVSSGESDIPDYSHHRQQLTFDRIRVEELVKICNEFLTNCDGGFP